MCVWCGRWDHNVSIVSHGWKSVIGWEIAFFCWGRSGPHGHGTLSEHVCITFHCQSRECISNRKNKTLPWPWCLCRRAQLHGPNFLFLRDFFCPSFQVILLLSTLLFFLHKFLQYLFYPITDIILYFFIFLSYFNVLKAR